jgi:hypothetical protein
MVYVERDAAGRIVRVEHQAFADMTETLSLDDAELLGWLAMREGVHERLAQLKSSDLEMIRVLEDLVDVLVTRGVLRYTDLPAAAREKLHARAEVRSKLGDLSSLLGDTEEHKFI